MRVYWESVLGRGNSRCKGPEVEPVWHSRSSKEPSWVGAEWSRGRGWTSITTPGALSLRDCVCGGLSRWKTPFSCGLRGSCLLVNVRRKLWCPWMCWQVSSMPPIFVSSSPAPRLCCLVLTTPSWEHSLPLALQKMSTPTYLSDHFF